MKNVKGVDSYHSRNNFYSFGEKRTGEEGMKKNSSIKQVSKDINKPLIHLVNRDTAAYKSNEASTKTFYPKNVSKGIYSKITYLKANICAGKKAVGSRQVHKEVNQTAQAKECDQMI